MRVGIFKKFGAFAALVGILPLIITVLILSSKMRGEFLSIMEQNYSQITLSLQDRIDSTLANYDTITTMPYYYRFGPSDNYLSFDTFRRIFYGTGYSENVMEAERKRDVESFLSNLIMIDSYIAGALFVGYDEDLEELAFAVDSVSGSLNPEPLLKDLRWEEGDKSYRGLSIGGIMEYRGGVDVYVLSRNYFDIRGMLSDIPYVGTLYLLVDKTRFDELFLSLNTVENDGLYLVYQDKVIYAEDQSLIGESLPSWSGKRLFYPESSKYGLDVNIIVDPFYSYGVIDTLYLLSFLLLSVSILVFTLGIVVISKRFSKQMEKLFIGMDRVEKGDFDVPEIKENKDELGELYERFRAMGASLKAYIDKAYSAQLKQKEAELTSLKSQIYPHFLYNTLEVIRMNALSSDDEKTAEMIEALSEQIHYLIGPVRDFVPLSHEIDIVRKYIFLLNCRTEGSIQFSAPSGFDDIIVPKLILQPLVENAYIHGLKPKGMKGSIAIEITLCSDDVEISVLDNGIGMDEKGIERINELLKSDSIGIKDEHSWKSVGLKNVSDRINLLYGPGYGLSLDSKENVGTVFTIKIKKKERGGEDVSLSNS